MSLGQGEGFGEIAILSDTRRTATVVSKTALELVYLEKKDFDAILGQQ